MGTEQKDRLPSSNFAVWIFKVLYSPLKAFEEIVNKPTVMGSILILIMILPLVIGGQYISGTKLFFEVPSPENDLWTEKPSNSPTFLWLSNDNITFDNSDYVTGNFSIHSSLNDSSQIWIRLTQIGSYNCSEDEYSSLSFRMKWINPINATPSANLQLYSSNNENNQFNLNITSLITDGSNLWSNVTIDLRTNNWTITSGSPIWANITGVNFQLTWMTPSNLTLKIDDLFLGKYSPVTSLQGFELQLVYYGVRSIVNFLLEWLILSGIILLALKSFSSWKGEWKNLFAVVGYVYSTFIIYFAALILLFFALPPFFFPHNYTIEIIELYQSSWGIPSSILSLIFYGWTAILCVIALKKIHELSWSRAALIGLAAVFLSAFWGSFLLSVFF